MIGRVGLLASMLLLSHVAACSSKAVPIAPIDFEDEYSRFSYDRFLPEGDQRSIIVKTVKDYIARNTSSGGALVLKGKESGRRWRFRLVEVFGVVSIRDATYTVQVDVDEMGGEPMHLLFFDVVESGSEYAPVRVRYGGRHMRQKMEASVHCRPPQTDAASPRR